VLTEAYAIDYFGGAAGGAILKSLQESPVKDWYAWLELGCFYYEARSFDAAEAAFRKSLGCRENPLALTALAKLSAARGRGKEGVPMMKRALALTDEQGGEYVRLVIEAAAFVKAHGTPEEAEELIRQAVDAHPAYLDNGRIALLYIQNLVKQGQPAQLEKAEKLLLKVPEIADMREGEVSTSGVWVELYRKKIAAEEQRAEELVSVDEVLKRYPVPAEIDFRMSGYQPH
jgi:tetratricopeptide (TPR) repeat protein